jgi:diaminopimelate epimerase
MKTTAAENKQLLELSSDMGGKPGAFDFYYHGDNEAGDLHGWYKVSNATYDIHADSSGRTVSDGNWHHVAMVVDASQAGTTNYVKVYLDRQVFDRSSASAPLTQIRNDRLYIGSRNGSLTPFNGQLDDIRISDTALSTNDFLKARSEFSVLAYYRFDSTNALADASGNGRTLIQGTGSAAAFSNDMAVFNGSVPYLCASNIFSAASYSNATVEFYMRTTHTVAKQILELSPNMNSYKGVFDFYTETLKLRSWYKAAYNTSILSAQSVSDGYWHHVAMVIDASKAGTTSYVSVYVDRLLQSNTASGVASNLINQTLFIGARNGNTDSFVGQLDDIRICASALPPEQFLVARTGIPVVPPEVIAYWKFDDGNPLADASGNGYMLTNATGMTTDKCAAVFNGTQGCKTAKNLNLVPCGGDLTIEYFVKTTAAQDKQILELSSNYYNLDGSWDFFCLGATGGGAVHGIFNTGGDGYNHHASTGSITNGNWHHVALVIDSSKADTADYVQLYLDKTAAPYTGVNIEKRWARSPLRSDTVYIGARSLGTDLFTGQLDDVKITAAALPVSAFMTKRSTPVGLLISIQ